MEGEAAQGMDLNGEAYDRCLSSYMDDGSTESHRYYLSRRTALEMLRDRGYSVPTSEIELSLKDFRGLHGQNPDIDRLRISASLRSDPSNKVEIFQITELLVNITKHEFKPKHRVLTGKEKKKLLEKFTLEEKQLPRMLQKDAIARYYGLEKGQVVKVTYSDDITESHVSYRCVW